MNTFSIFTTALVLILAPLALADDAIKIEGVQRPITNYTIELMWINDQLDPDTQFIWNGKGADVLRNELFEPALRWAKANPDADVRIWYDGMHTTAAAILASNDLLQKAMRESGVANVRLRDSQEIPIIRANQDVFSSQVPVYVRVDILKVILVAYSVSQEGHDAAVFADQRIGRSRPTLDQMNKEELFDRQNLEQLEKWGFIIGCDSWKPENQYFQLVNNSEMIEAIKHVIVNANLLRIVTILNLQPELRTGFQYFNDAMSDTIGRVFAFFALKEKSLRVRPDILGLGAASDPWIDYDPKVHGYRPFGDLVSTSRHPGLLTKDGFVSPRKVTNLGNLDDSPNDYCRRNLFGKDGGDHAVPDELLSRVLPPADGESYKATYWF